MARRILSCPSRAARQTRPNSVLFGRALAVQPRHVYARLGAGLVTPGRWREAAGGLREEEPLIARLAWVKDKAALARQLARWSAIEPLARILPSHGQAIEGDVNATLMRLADSLA